MNDDPQEVNESPESLLFGEPIFSYTRAQAIEDGVLVDVTTTAREAGFKWPVALTAEVWALIEQIPEHYGHEDIQGRLWDVLTMARWAIKGSQDAEADEIEFDLMLHQEKADRLRLKLHAGPGDNGEPVFTLMLPHED